MYITYDILYYVTNNNMLMSQNRVTYLADNQINDPHKAYYYLVTTMTGY